MVIGSKRRSEQVIGGRSKRCKLGQTEDQNVLGRSSPTVMEKETKPYEVQKPLDPGWREVLSLPPGWRLREVEAGGKLLQYIRSPQAKLFPCRRLALRHILEQGQDEEAVAMREVLVHEGWKENQLLPEGWRYKPGTGRDMEFLTTNCTVLKGYICAKEYLETNKEASPTTIQNFKSFMTPKVQEQCWEIDKRLPEGWKVKRYGGVTAGDRIFVMDPNGAQFAGKRKALLHMIENSYSEEDIQAMKLCMGDEGWNSSEHLPEGWIWRYDRTYDPTKKSKPSIVFLSSEGFLLRSSIAAIKFMETSNSYDDENIQLFNVFVMEASTVWRKMKVEDSTTDLSLPEGWKSRVSGAQVFVVSPEGEQYNSSRLALMEMVKRGLSEEDLRRFRESMSEWKLSELLPTDWMYKIITREKGRDAGGQQVVFLNPEGAWIRGRKQAFEIIKNMDKDVVTRYNEFIEQCTINTRKDCYEWNDDDTLPEGWKSRFGGNRQYFLSPEGHRFESRVAILQHMIQTGCSVAQIEEMRNLTLCGDWKESADLPQGWIYKYERTTAPSKNSCSKVLFLTSCGQYLRSFIKTVKFMEDSELYNADDINGVNNLMEKSTLERRKTTFLHQTSAAKLDLPEGWKSRVVGTREHVVSPEGEQYNSSRLALIEMVKRGLPEDDLRNMRVSMSEWKMSDLLPKDWLYKADRVDTSSSPKTMFLTNTGESIRSFVKVIRFMEDSDVYGEEDIKGVNALMMKSTAEWRKTRAESTSASLALPEGWKSRVVGSKEYIVSPEGEQYNSSRLALAEMARRGLPEEDLERMRGSMVDWESSELLPRGWLFKILTKKSGSTQTYILSSHGEQYRGRLKALDAIKQQLGEEEVAQFKMFSDLRSVQTRVEKYEWNEDDKTIPAGWKSRIGGSKYFFLSPEGQQFPSRVAILQHMIQEETDADALEEMRDFTIHEGWKMSQYLPFRWVYRHTWSSASDRDSVLNIKILSEEGHMMDSYIAAKSYMEDNNKFDENDIENVDKFCEENAKVRRLSFCKKSEDIETESETNQHLQYLQYLPDSWSMKKSGSKTFFFAPDGRMLSSLRLVLQYLFSQNSPEEDLAKVRTSLDLEGWQENPLLPLNWRFKSVGEKHPAIKFMTGEGDEITNSEAALKLVESGLENYKWEDIEAFKTFLEIKSGLVRTAKYTWVEGEDEDLLPKGWRMRKTSKHTLYLSPEGHQVTSLPSLLQHIMKTEHTPEDLEIVKTSLINDGFTKHENLPENWLVKQWHTKLKEGSSKSEHRNLKILSPEGKVYMSYLAAARGMEEDDKYSKAAIQRMLIGSAHGGASPHYLKDKSVNGIPKKQLGWEDDATLPEGWRIKSSVSKAGVMMEIFLTPEGKQLVSRHSALQHLIQVRKVFNRPV